MSSDESDQWLQLSPNSNEESLSLGLGYVEIYINNQTPVRGKIENISFDIDSYDGHLRASILIRDPKEFKDQSCVACQLVSSVFSIDDKQIFDLQTAEDGSKTWKEKKIGDNFFENVRTVYASSWVEIWSSNE